MIDELVVLIDQLDRLQQRGHTIKITTGGHSGVGVLVAEGLEGAR